MTFSNPMNFFIRSFFASAFALIAFTSLGAAWRGPGPIRFTVAPTGNEVRYRVREKLMELDMPSDAVGKTSAVQGAIAIAPDGSVATLESKFVVQAGTLKSDHPRRDRYIQNQTLETDSYPSIIFVPTAVRGLASPVPTSGTRAFQLVGNLTIHGVTKPVTWNVKATLNGADVTGNATTTFTFDYFDLDQPNVPVVLSVDDNIVLEYDFHLVRAKGS